ncbi:MAG: C-terminal binding protein [Planctomycetota bacterium]|nr:C-terminal binding protein [Planctomycetota bacterium]
MDLSSYKVVRLNAELFPITEFEQQKYAEHRITPVAIEAASRDELTRSVQDADAVMVVSQSLPAEVIETMQRCRVICRLGAGTDKIDVVAATASGIVVSNVPDFCVEEQADHSFALLLAVARQLNQLRNRMLAGQYHDARRQCRELRRLSGCTLGLVGFGRSAKAMARRAAGFGMRVAANRRNQSIVDPDSDALDVEMVSLERLLAVSDFVSLHLPLDDQTSKMFDKRILLMMKPGSVLINTSRGAIVDEQALVEVLQTQHLAGAGLDTFDVINVHAPNPAPPKHPLLQMENVVFTPHVAAFSVDSSRDVGFGSVANLVAVLSGHWPPADRVVNAGVQPRQPLHRA